MKYLILEIGDSAYTEFKTKHGEFMQTEDAILVDEIQANTEEEAYEMLFNLPEHSHKCFDRLVIKQVVD